MATVEYVKKDNSYTQSCFLKESGRLVATIQSFGDFARIFPAIGMERLLSMTDWRSVGEAKIALEREASKWSIYECTAI